MNRVIIILLLLFSIASALVTAPAASAQSTLGLQEKCSKAANNLFVASGYNAMGKSEELGQCISSYESHYNKKLDKCFILLSGRCYKKDESSGSADLADVFANKGYASYTGIYAKNGTLKSHTCVIGDNQFNMVNGFEFNKQTKKWDIISEAYVHSLKEPFSDPVRKKFDNWVKPYMEE